VTVSRRSRRASEWRAFADRRSPAVLRALPAALPNRRLRACPRHEVGQTTRMCLACHTEAWNEIAREFVASRERGAA
jgi:hypothetical protein